MRYALGVEYDGSGFLGWQRLTPPGVPGEETLQQALETALSRVADAPVDTVCAGRTDAGVHAVGQTASFTLARPLEPLALQRALNALLPEDVRVLAAAEAPPGFHARKSARSKLYRYLLDAGAVPLPTRRRLAGHVPWRLDEARVLEAATVFLGRQDFAALASAGSSVRTSVRTVSRSEARFQDTPDQPGGRTLVYEVEADGFLRRMVRSIVGGLLAVGRGALSVEQLRHALEARDRSGWPPPAPACGLTLVRVDDDATTPTPMLR
jgi:tRNA pseudouridine38-40 synthase